MKSCFSSSSYLSMSSLILSIALLVFLNNTPQSISLSDLYTSCSNQFKCGNITQVGFPFWGDARPGDCGYPELKLTCSGDGVTTIQIMDVQYRVLEINQDSQTLKIVRDDYFDKICSAKFGNTRLDSNMFDYVSGSSVDVTLLYGCASGNELICPNGETYGDVSAVPATVPSIIPVCKSSVLVRVSLSSLNQPTSISELEEAIRQGFEVKYKVDSAAAEICDQCVGSKGVCGYDSNLNNTICYCPNQTSSESQYSGSSCSARAQVTDPGQAKGTYKIENQI